MEVEPKSCQRGLGLGLDLGFEEGVWVGKVTAGAVGGGKGKQKEILNEEGKRNGRRGM